MPKLEEVTFKYTIPEQDYRPKCMTIKLMYFNDILSQKMLIYAIVKFIKQKNAKVK